MRETLRNLLQGKYAITYTLTTMTNMIPREIRWLNKLPILNHGIRIVQFFWYLTKIIFFTMVISWFKPQYNQGGAKIALFVITIGLIFFAFWIMKKELNRREMAG